MSFRGLDCLPDRSPSDTPFVSLHPTLGKTPAAQIWEPTACRPRLAGSVRGLRLSKRTEHSARVAEPHRTGTDDPVWYVAYGSNLSRDRFRTYLEGGVPVGSRRAYLGARDRTPPRRSEPIWLQGHLCFGGRSTVWGGGLAFFDPEGDGRVAARAHLVTFGQFSDVVAQEARTSPGADLVRGPNGAYTARSSVYDAILELGELEGSPMVTMTSSRRRSPVAPSEAYLSTIMRGLDDGFGMRDVEVVAYLLAADGVRPTWTEDRLGDLLVEVRASGQPAT
jgi:hypothetical protein